MVMGYSRYAGDNAQNVIPIPKPKAPIVRASVAPGRVLILPSERFRGKRVVCLKQMKSGLLCVAGSCKLNGVPCKRISQVYTMSSHQR